MEKEPTVVLGSPKTANYPEGYIKGSIATKCERCPTEVVLSPATMTTMQKVGPTIVLCDACMEVEINKPDIEKLIAEAKEAHDGPLFLGVPEEWMDDPHWWCKNGHLSTRTLRRDSGPHRYVCLACYEPVMTGPKELPGVVPK